MKIPDHIQIALNQLKDKDILRQLSPFDPSRVDFSSNDFLGNARSPFVPGSPAQSGAGGSRLLSGNHECHDLIEQFCKNWFETESAVLYNSGYAANIGLLSCISAREDTIFFDENCHASIKEGVRLSTSKYFSFKHNDYNSLRQKIRKANGNCFIVTEAVFSMDGDSPNAQELKTLCEETGAFLVIDEAHSTGLFGEKGRGWVIENDLQEFVFAKIMTFGKAVGRMGAVVCGPEKLKSWLINKSRSFIYTTALPPVWAEDLLCSLKRTSEMEEERNKLRLLREYLNLAWADAGLPALPDGLCILPFVVGSIHQTKAIAKELQTHRLDVRPIVSPTVKSGTERLRITLHAYNSNEEIDRLIESIRTSI